MERETFTFYSSWLTSIDGFPQEQQAEIVLALVQYCANGTEPDLSKPYIKMAFNYAKQTIDRNYQLYLNGKRGGAPKGTHNNRYGRGITNQELTNNKPLVVEETEESIKEKEGDVSQLVDEAPVVPKKKPHFVPPTYEQVKAFFIEKSRPDMDPQAFINYYESVGWMIGKKKMVSWRGAAGGWLSRNPNLLLERKHTLLQDDSKIGKFNKFLLQNFPFVAGHMKELITEKQLDALMRFCTKSQITDALGFLEDRKEYTKKHTNLYYTLYEYLKPNIRDAANK